MPKWNSPYWTEHDRKAALIEKYAKLRYNEDGTIVVTDVMKTNPPIWYRPNAVVDYRNGNGFILRTVYDEHARQKTRIHSTDHGYPKHHPAGGHAHDATYTVNGHPTPRPPSRALTDEERRAHADILR